MEWNFINARIDRCTGFGRIAFAVPAEEVSHLLRVQVLSPEFYIFPLVCFQNIQQSKNVVTISSLNWSKKLHLPFLNQLIFRFQLEPIQKKMEKMKQKILTPLVKLDTPGKAAVQVVILADPVSDEFPYQVTFNFIL